MTVFLCIDLMGGKAVQLVQGKKKALEVDNVIGLAEELAKLENPIDIIDLDAALGSGDNLEQIKLLCKKLRCRVGGGIRSMEKARELIEAGAEKIIIGTNSFKQGKLNEEFLSRLKNEFGKERIIISVDSVKGKIVDRGWTRSTGIKTLDVIKDAENYCSEIFYTYVDKEGTMEGTDFETVRKIRELVAVEVTAAGGISSSKEIEMLESIGVNSVVGMAYYTGKIKMEELQRLKSKRYKY
ncbi:1-(5-phosphoribosyl)-5-[(5-phosphoribosylamino)methylideneamino] imidazole-4-carboxamide isomerase [Candidatus Woesearchaeota archaeon]|nr:1-(5-phosphoribosyl)-5-[(5-phosphoribosylamino)methylideneamino] imidazole-4-carboxamide isomerase [Candidatus Woesearchaeota archaeon]